MNIVLNKNLGIFKISKAVTKNPEIMACFFGAFTILKLDIDFQTGHYMMLCESDVFDNVNEGDPIPQYQCEIKRNENGTVEVSNVFKQ